MSNGVWINGGEEPVLSAAEGPCLLAALPCEDGTASASMGDGRVSLQRIFYDLHADGFPAGFDRLNVATIWMGGGGTHVVGVRLSGPDGDVLAEAEMEHVALPEPVTAIRFFPLSSDGVLTLALPAPGRYSVDVLLDGVPVHTFPIFVVDDRKEQEADGGTD